MQVKHNSVIWSGAMGHEASCSCGWNGGEHASKETAQQAIDAHRAAAGDLPVAVIAPVAQYNKTDYAEPVALNRDERELATLALEYYRELDLSTSVLESVQALLRKLA